MSQGLAYRLVAGLSGLFAVVSALAAVGLVRAGREASELGQIVAIDWAGFIVPAMQVVLTFALSVAALVAVFAARPTWRHRFAKAFCFGVPALIGARLIGSSVVAASPPPVLPTLAAVSAALGLVLLGLLVRPNIALKPTAGDVAQSPQPPGPAAA